MSDLALRRLVLYAGQMPGKTSPSAGEPPPRLIPNSSQYAVPTAVTRCAFCEAEIRTSCIRDVRVELRTALGGLAGEISLVRNFFCLDPKNRESASSCVLETAATVMAECNDPRDPEDPVFPEIMKKFRGKITEYKLGFTIVGPAGSGSVPANGPGDIHGAGYSRVTTPGFADQTINNPR